MADNYLERQRERYEAAKRKMAARKRKTGKQKAVSHIERPEDESL